jgi:hypothetical protein
MKALPMLFVGLLFLCGAAQSENKRSAAEVSAFKRQSPCPSTQERRSVCPGYQVHHIMPLCAGGADKMENMQWLTVVDHKAKTRQDLRVCRYLRKIKD